MTTNESPLRQVAVRFGPTEVAAIKELEKRLRRTQSSIIREGLELVLAKYPPATETP